MPLRSAAVLFLLLSQPRALYADGDSCPLSAPALESGGGGSSGASTTCGCSSSRSSVAARSSDGSSEEGAGACAAPSAAAAAAPPPPAAPPRLSICRIPAGTAQLGTDTPGVAGDGEAPAFSWTLPAPLWLDEGEVTVSRFAAFVAAQGYVSEAHVYNWSFVHEQALAPAAAAAITTAVRGTEWWLPVPGASWRSPEGGDSDALADGRGEHPAVHTSLRDAAAFCAAAGGRLPSEDEWEYAARGGRAARDFPWGAALTPGGRHRANVWQGAFPHNNSCEDGHCWASPVLALGPQNGWGLHGMVGNAWEWTATPWCARAAGAAVRAAVRRAGLPWAPSARPGAEPPDCAALRAPQRAAQAADVGEVDYVKKGGSFMCHRSYCYRYRCAARHKNTVNSGAYNLGFRCAYDAPPAGAVDCLSGERVDGGGLKEQ